MYILGACGPINETYEQVEFTETTTAETATSTTTALTGSLTAVTGKVSTVTTLDTTGALTSVTDGSTVIDTVTAETEAEKQQDNMQDNMQDVVAEQPSEIEIKVEDTKYNDSNSETLTTQAVTTTATETTIVTTLETAPIITETEAVVTEEYVVYKPSTKYAHRSTCRWNKDDAYRCDDFSQLETRICTECNPDIGEHIEYQAPTVGGNADKDNMSYAGNFKMTYYPATHYYPGVCGGSTRTLIGYGTYDSGIRGSVASRSLYEMYGYERNGRTTIYLEFPSYPEMDGIYFLDDYCAHYGVIDVFVFSEYACPFGYDGVTWADCWIY
jgi:hypothetical protein